MRLTLKWDGSEYRVNVPNFDGGEVVTADEVAALEATLRDMEAERCKWAEIAEAAQVEVVRLAGLAAAKDAVIEKHSAKCRSKWLICNAYHWSKLAGCLTCLSHDEGCDVCRDLRAALSPDIAAQHDREIWNAAIDAALNAVANERLAEPDGKEDGAYEQALGDAEIGIEALKREVKP